MRERIRQFDESYKRDWQKWMAVATVHPLSSAGTAAQFRATLCAWQAVRARVKGRTVLPCRAGADDGTLCVDDLLAESAAIVPQLGDFSLREAAAPSQRQRRALHLLWEVFRALPTVGVAKAVGITKAIKLVTLGRVGPAFDSVARDNMGVDEPATGDEWVDALRAIAKDLAAFERRHQISLESLVEERWAPIAVGRAYDMVVGPPAIKGTKAVSG